MISALKTGFGSLAAPRFCPLQSVADPTGASEACQCAERVESGLGLSCGQASVPGISYYIYE
jgi:hypothetical protein